MGLIQNLVDLAQTPGVNDWRVTVPVTFILMGVTTYVLTTVSNFQIRYMGKDGEEPPIVPYWLPVFGSTIPFVRDTKNFIKNTVERYGEVPFTIKLAAFKGYLITQPEHYGQLLKATRSLSNKRVMAELMRDVFGTPLHVLTMYLKDNSGIEPKPLPGTSIPMHQRIWANQHHDSNKYLSGEPLAQLATRFTSVLSGIIARPDPNDPVDSGEWVVLDDFMPWWRSRVFTAAATALFGASFLRINPGLEEDFWRFVEAVPTLAKRYPAWMAPKSHAARNKMLEHVKRWHKYAREHQPDYRVVGDDEGAPKTGWDEHWGSAWMKVRQRWGQDTGIMDDNGLASEDLALTIAANGNAIPIAFWYLIEVYKDPSLLARVQSELDAAVTRPYSPGDDHLPAVFDMQVVLNSPLAQSVYAEVLRMRISLLLNRTPDTADYRMGRWTLKKGAYATLPTAHVGYHPTAWAPYTDGGRAPVEEFWADRFLIPDEENEGKMKYSTQHLEGIWVPYGGGALMCPGRHFAKQEIMGSITVFAHYYELEVINGRAPTMDEAFYGFGAQQPDEKTPVRIRRRAGGWKTSN